MDEVTSWNELVFVLFFLFSFLFDFLTSCIRKSGTNGARGSFIFVSFIFVMYEYM